MDKQLTRVLDAVNEGGETSDQISAMIGLSIASVSAHLHELFSMELIRRTHTNSLHRVRDDGRCYGPRMHRYAPRLDVDASSIFSARGG